MSQDGHSEQYFKSMGVAEIAAWLLSDLGLDA